MHQGRRSGSDTRMTQAVPDARMLALSAAPQVARQALLALFALDDRLAGIVRTTREPMIGQMRLTWWRDALIRLDDAPAPAEPVLSDVQAHIMPHGVSGAMLAGMIDGWEALIVAESVGAPTVELHASMRGERLFAAAAVLLGADSPLVAPAGHAWASEDLVRHLSRPNERDVAVRMADAAFQRAFSKSWPRSLQALGLMTLFAHLDRSGQSSIAKAMRVTRFRITGR